ncbi:MAG: hypothetical protein BGO99_06250 [Nitrosospira sp. 56-18]|nr:MAG: hypothetical protein BGO99_06250 [Nitrosospira sp. 56-18]
MPRHNPPGDLPLFVTREPLLSASLPVPGQIYECGSIFFRYTSQKIRITNDNPAIRHVTAIKKHKGSYSTYRTIF